MFRLLIKYLLKGTLDITKVKREWIDDPLAYKLFYMISKSYKNGNNLTIDGVEILIKQNEAGDEKAKLLAYLTSVKSTDESISEDEVINSIYTSYILKNLQGDLHDVITAASSRDIDTLVDKLKEASFKIKGVKAKELKRAGEGSSNNLFMLPSFSSLLNEQSTLLTGLTVVGAKSGGGKSLFAINEVYDKWVRGEPSVYFSLEMPIQLVEARLLSLMTGVLLQDIINDLLVGKARIPLSDKNRKLIDEARNKLLSPDTPDIFIEDTLFTSSEIEDTIIKYRREYGVKLFVIDYINLVTISNGSQDWSGKAKWIKDLNKLCMNEQIVIICPSQVTIEKDSSGELTLKTSGTIELLNSASIVFLLYVSEEAKSANMIELHVTKNRSGTKPVIGFERNFHIAKFTDLAILN